MTTGTPNNLLHTVAPPSPDVKHFSSSGHPEVRAKKHPFDKHLYRERRLIEYCFSKFKQFRRLARCYEKTARNFLAIVTLAAIIPRLR